MSTIDIKLPNGENKIIQKGTKVCELLNGASTDNTIGITLNGAQLDLNSPITETGEIKIIELSSDSENAKYFYRHSFSHILAQAVKRLYPEAKLAIGPAIEDGFYYDFDVKEPFTPEDLKNITKEMKKIIKENHSFERIDVNYEEAKKMLAEQNEPYKLELLEEIKSKGESITFYKDGDFIDLCRGPHIPSTKLVRNFKLLSVAGAYWRGDENKKMLQRIYGTAFLNKDDLKSHLAILEEAKKRDHRKLGKELDLYSINPDTIGGGLVLWHQKGGFIRNLVEEHCRKKHLDSGYDIVYSPHIGKSTLWETSGHLQFYEDGMFPPLEMDGHKYYLKPMNCPFHCNIYGSNLRSYKDLPLRFAEWGTVYRFERSGTLHGLTRVRGFTQDDAHLFCRPDQMPEEIDKVLDFSLSLLRDFGLSDFHLYLSTRPEKSVGDDSKWEAAEAALEAALKRSGISYSLNAGDGAFYGPKIDICITDSLKREWQLSTIQFDFNLPVRFDLKYIGDDGKEHRPYMIHRALLGSMERFFAILIEHTAGIFPVWLAPTQIMVLPIAETHHEYAEKVLNELKNIGFRVQKDVSSNTLSYRVRTAQKQKIPFMLILGDKECENKEITIRLRSGDNLELKSISEFKAYVEEKTTLKEAV